MTFGAPLFFWAFAAFPLLIAIFFANERRRTQLLTRLVAARLAPRLAGNVSVVKRRVRFLLVLLGLAAAIVALAQPRYGFDWEQTKRKGRDVIIAIDTSRSMLADDLKPNRLTRAKLAAQDLIAELQTDRVGVVAFAGTAFLQAPLTVDYGAVLGALNELDTEIIPQGGTNIAEMIQTARDAFGKGESDNRALIVFTDGEELDTNGIKAAEELKKEIRIFTVGVGSTEGALIPLPGRGGKSDFVKDDSGQIVKSRLDEDRLRTIAESTGGFYIRLQSGRPEMQKIVQDGLRPMSEQDIDARLSRHPIERYQWPLSAALVLLAASTLIGERRRGAPRLRAALALLLLPMCAHAVNPGLEQYQRHKYPEALNEFSTQLKRQPQSPALQFDRGAAAYKAGDLDQALAAFSQAVTSPDPHLRTRASYNLGNTLFQRGVAQKEKEPKIQEWKNALQHYEEALKVEPKNADAIYNRDVVRKLLEELEKEQQQDQQKKDDKKDDQKKDDQKKDQQQQQNKDDQQKEDQQKQDQQDKKDQKDQQQPKDGQDQKDQKDQEKKDGSSQPKDGEQKEDQKPQDGKGEQEKPQDEKGDKKDQPQKGDQQDEKKDQPQKDAKDGEQKKDGKAGEKPEPSQDQPQPQKQGEVKPAQPQKGDEKQDAQAEEAANAQAAAEGKMTEQQANALLDSLKNEDQKVRLLDTRKQSKSSRTLRNW
jgi:Ca-activated chloride channel family protein